MPRTKPTKERRGRGRELYDEYMGRSAEFEAVVCDKAHYAEASTHRRSNSKRNRRHADFVSSTLEDDNSIIGYTELRENPSPDYEEHNERQRRKVPIVIEDNEPRKQSVKKKQQQNQQPGINVYYPMPSKQRVNKSTQHTSRKLSLDLSLSASTSYDDDQQNSSSLEEGEDSREDSFTLGSSVSGTTGSYTADALGSALEYGSDQGSSSLDERKQNRSRWLRDRMPVLSKSASTITSLETNLTDNGIGDDSGGMFGFVASDLTGILYTKQDVAYCSVLFVSLQLLVLMLQLTMCGVAPFDTNMMVGPFPDAFSVWGGKNPYLLLVGNEWWRFFTPAFLNVGFLHLIVNAWCIFSGCALFEREWGWSVWLFFLFVGTIGCTAFSNYLDPDTIAVGSSGSLLGIYGAKLSDLMLQVLTSSDKKDERELISLRQVSVILLGMIALFFLGCFTYIDLSGNLGGLLCGLSAGLMYFSHEIHGCCWRFLVSIIGMCALIVPTGAALYYFMEESRPSDQLGDVCEYFRSLFTEDYECGCMW